MIRRIRGRLASDRGASVLMVLLLFLFCAMAGSAILAAASTGPGRLAGRGSADRSYYKVISAARLFAEEIEGKAIEFHMTRTDDSEDWGGASYSDLTYSDGRTGGWIDIPGSSPAPHFDTILEDAAYWMIGKTILEGDQDEAWEGRFGTSPTYGYKDFEADLTGASDMKVYGRLAVQGSTSGTGKLQRLTLAAVSSDSIPSGAPFVSSSGDTFIADGAYHVWISCEGTVDLETPPRADPDNDDTTEIMERTITIRWGKPTIVDEIGG